jgi:ankyrin repeat protein
MQAELVNEQLIEACTEEPQSFDKIRNLVESCPDAATMRNSLRLLDRDGDECIIEGYPLHFAVLNETVSLQVVEYLVEQFPRAVKEANCAYERLPLHFACLNEAASLVLVPYLVEQWPDSVRETSADGRLPLHLVCLNKAASPELVQYLVEQWPGAVRVANSYDYHLPLHSACWSDKVSLQVVQYLVEQFPDAIKMADKAGNFPFHRACGKGAASLEVVQYLVEQWPDAIRVSGADKRLPLDVACWSRGTVSLEVLQFLVEQYPDAVKSTRPGNENYLPFHAICTNDNAPLDALRFLFEQWPDAIKLRSWGGRLPLHLICSRETVSELDVVQYLVEQWPDAAKMTDSEGLLPLHVACGNDIVALEVVQYLVAQWPDAVKITTDKGRLPLHLVCSRETRSALEVVQYVVEEWPDAVKIADSEGKLALHLACGKIPLLAVCGSDTISLEIVQYLVDQWPNSAKGVSWDTSICCIQHLNWQVHSCLGNMIDQVMAATEPAWTPTEALFRPTKNSLTERAVELLPGLTTDDILVTGITWEVFCYFLHVVKSVWITETTCVYLTSRYAGLFSCWFSIGHPESANVKVGFSGNSPEPTVALLLRLLTNSEHQVVRIDYSGRYINAPLPVSGPTLSCFFEESNARRVELACVTLDEAQCRALATVSRSNMEIQLQYCSLSGDAGCRDAFIECLQSDGGPMDLDRCQIDCQILAVALAGKSRVVKAHLWLDTSMAALTLKENWGLEELRIDDRFLDDDNWWTMCEALQTHPTLTGLYYGYFSSTPHALSAKQRKSRTLAIADMLKTNNVLRTIYQDDVHGWDTEIYEDLILPRLATNLFRHRLVTVQEITADPFRKKVLGRVLQSESVRSDSDRIWMVLSSNMNIVLDAANVSNLNN